MTDHSLLICYTVPYTPVCRRHRCDHAVLYHHWMRLRIAATMQSAGGHRFCPRKSTWPMARPPTCAAAAAATAPTAALRCLHSSRRPRRFRALPPLPQLLRDGGEAAAAAMLVTASAVLAAVAVAVASGSSTRPVAESIVEDCCGRRTSIGTDRLAKDCPRPPH